MSQSPLHEKLIEIDETLEALAQEVKSLRNEFFLLKSEIKSKQQRMKNEKESE